MVNGLHGEQMLLGLAIGIVLLIFMVLKTKIQAFLVYYQRIWKYLIQYRYYYWFRRYAGSNL